MNALKRRLASPSFQLVLGSVVGQAILFAVSPIITRLFSPAEFAVLSIYTAIVSLFAAFVVLRMDVALFTVPQERLPQVVRAAAVTAAAMSVLVAIGYFGFGLATHVKLTDVSLGTMSVLLALGLWGSSVYATVSSATVMKGEYRATTTTRVVQALAGSAVQVGAGLLGLSSPGLILGYLVSQSFGITRLWKLIGREQSRVRPREWPREARTLSLGEFRGFTLYSAPASILNRLSGSLSVILFAAVYDLHASGLFALALRSTSAPLLAVGRGIAQTFQKEYAGSRTRSQRQVILSTIRAMALMGAVPCLALLVLGPWLFHTVFGRKWTEAGTYAAILSPSLLLQFIAYPIAQAFSLGKHFRRQLLWDGTRASVILALFGALYLGKVDVLAGVTAVSAVLSGIYLSQIIMAVLSSQTVPLGTEPVDNGQGLAA